MNMNKKFLVLLLTTIVVFFSVHAQDVHQPQVKTGEQIVDERLSEIAWGFFQGAFGLLNIKVGIRCMIQETPLVGIISGAIGWSIGFMFIKKSVKNIIGKACLERMSTLKGAQQKAAQQEDIDKKNGQDAKLSGVQNK